MRNPFKRQSRSAETPSLRERAATLKSGLSRLLHRSDAQEGANQHRRALVAGSVAAAIPLPVLARTVAPAPVPAAAEALPLALPGLVASPHPDQALLDLGAALDRAIEAEAKAGRAAADAWKLVGPVLARRPAEIVVSEFECPLFEGHHNRGRSVPGLGLNTVHYVPGSDHPTDHWGWRHAWTAAALRLLIAHAVPVLGQGGQTPHRIRHWRGLLPIAEAFDAEVAAAYAASDYRRLSDEKRAAEAVVRDLRIDICDATATTPEGLAIHVRTLFTPEWAGKQNNTYAALFRSAAAVAGVSLPGSDFDPAAWVAAWERAGGKLRWLPHRHGRDELAFVMPREIDAGPENTAELHRLSQVRADNGRDVERWLRANR